MEDVKDLEHDRPHGGNFLSTSGNIWAGEPLHAPLMDLIREVVRNNPKSLRKGDQKKQKQLFLDLASVMKSFKRNGDSRTWRDLVMKLNGPAPINPIFLNS